MAPQSPPEALLGIKPRKRRGENTHVPVPVTETGFTNAFPGMLSAFSQWDQFEQVPELLWPNSVRTYTRMWREDARIASVYYAISLPIQRTQWRIHPNGANDGRPTPRVKDRFSWDKHLQWVMRYLLYGHAVFEQVYRIGDDGRAYLR